MVTINSSSHSLCCLSSFKIDRPQQKHPIGEIRHSVDGEPHDVAVRYEPVSMRLSCLTFCGFLGCRKQRHKKRLESTHLPRQRHQLENKQCNGVNILLHSRQTNKLNEIHHQAMEIYVALKLLFTMMYRNHENDKRLMGTFGENEKPPTK